MSRHDQNEKNVFLSRKAVPIEAALLRSRPTHHSQFRVQIRVDAKLSRVSSSSATATTAHLHIATGLRTPQDRARPDPLRQERRPGLDRQEVRVVGGRSRFDQGGELGVVRLGRGRGRRRRRGRRRERRDREVDVGRSERDNVERDIVLLQLLAELQLPNALVSPVICFRAYELLAHTLTSAAWLSLTGLHTMTMIRCRWFLFCRCLRASCSENRRESV